MLAEFDRADTDSRDVQYRRTLELLFDTYPNRVNPLGARSQVDATSDEIVPYAQDRDLVHYYCSHGVAVDHVTFPADHVTGEEVGAPLASAWLQGILSGQTPPSTCAATEAVDGLGADLPEVPAVPLLAVGGVLACAMVLRRRRRAAA